MLSNFQKFDLLTYHFDWSVIAHHNQMLLRPDQTKPTTSYFCLKDRNAHFPFNIDGQASDDTTIRCCLTLKNLTEPVVSGRLDDPYILHQWIIVQSRLRQG